MAYVYADWIKPNTPNHDDPIEVGKLESAFINGHEVFSFEYNSEWLESDYKFELDPQLQLFAGRYYPANEDKTFGFFSDSAPDRWGRLLMDRKEAYTAKLEGREPSNLGSMDYMLRVHDDYRMGALRYKLNPNGDFQDNNPSSSAPSIIKLKDLEYAASRIEEDDFEDDPKYSEWLDLILSEGSSLGGARPKACLNEVDKSLWIAKFPNKNDDRDIGLWEMVAYKLALDSGIEMSDSKVIAVNPNSKHHTFLTKRFDRDGGRRIHFSSAMAQLGMIDGGGDQSYLDIADFITSRCSNPKDDLEKLWRQIIFSIAISNTDGHLRNYGFILDNNGWRLAPAYDLNPSPKGRALYLNIDDSNNALDFDIALGVIDLFEINQDRAEEILSKVLEATSHWRAVATKLGIKRSEQDKMSRCFRSR